MDKIVNRLNDEIMNRIDCTLCGNCCEKLTAGLTDDDIKRLAEIENLLQKDFETNFVECDQTDGDKYLKFTPCKYLEDKKCSIYPDRPENCKSYPHTHKPGFTTRTLGIFENYSICPIVFNVFERLKAEIQFR